MKFHPLQRWEQHAKVRWLLGVSFVILLVVMSLIPLEPGILAYQFDALGVTAIWGSSEKLWAAFSLGLDFLYLAIYSTFFALECIRIANQFQHRSFAKLGIALAWGQWLAASVDSLENIALFAILLGSHNEALALTAKLFAVLKFSLVVTGLLYILAGCVFLHYNQTFKRGLCITF